ncbi:MAG: non-canonical purine NTP pyrophosphatase [Holosporales bacterium]|jgi:XTP/dITP diphosphohydrolase|nr:non-canonical purine NTP pyrophosphatase [Holosporales bacterium]
MPQKNPQLTENIISKKNKESKKKFNILLGTTNTKKINEFKAFWNIKNCNIQTLEGLYFPDVKENGKTYEENALIKARHYFKLTGIPTISDDSGLAINALGGFPGMYCARIAGPNKDFDRAKERVSEHLEGITDKSATFSVALAYVDARIEIVVRGDVYGEYAYKIVKCSNPDHYGWDDAFLPNGSKKTLADLNMKQKEIFSARSVVIKKLIFQLTRTMD